MVKIWTVSKDGALFKWEYVRKPDADETDDERWRIVDRQYFQKSPATVTCAAFHSQSNLLVTGFSIGIFTIHELPEFTEIQTLRLVASGSWLC